MGKQYRQEIQPQCTVREIKSTELCRLRINLGISDQFLFCGVCFIVFMSLIFVVLFVCLFTFRFHVSLLAFWLPVLNKFVLS